MAGQGRKPKTDAIRRQRDTQPVAFVEHLEMPAVVAGNDLMRECWEWTVADSTHFHAADVPMLTSLAYWWAVQRQCMTNLSAGAGVVTQVDTAMGPRQDPDIRTLQLATNQIRQLSSELGIGPLARTRMGLMKMATVSMAADLPERVFKMLDEHYGD